MIRQRLARFIVRRAGYRMVGEVPDTGILVGAPHTSNWDFVYMITTTWALGMPIQWLGQDNPFPGPLRFLVVPLRRGLVRPGKPPPPGRQRLARDDGPAARTADGRAARAQEEPRRLAERGELAILPSFACSAKSSTL